MIQRRAPSPIHHSRRHTDSICDPTEIGTQFVISYSRSLNTSSLG